MSIEIEISVGELLDKLTILEIKAARIKEKDKLININKELSLLNTLWQQSSYSNVDITQQLTQLKEINEALWNIEDKIRYKEAIKQFDDEFIDLARSVYVTNDQRAATKKTINLITGSNLIEEKSYKDY